MIEDLASIKLESDENNSILRLSASTRLINGLVILDEDI
jgi:hypothetical protein